MQGNVENLPLVLRVDDVGRVLDLSRVKAYELVHTAGFPAIRFGRALRIPREAFLRWLDAQTGEKKVV